jgi:hypothetical protein
MLWLYFAGFSILVVMAGGAWIVLGRLLTRATGSRAAWVPRIASVALVVFAGLIVRSAV